jgi:hypothetical protein
MYKFYEINEDNIDEIKNFLILNFSRSDVFWKKSISNFLGYKSFSNQKNFGYCYYFNNKAIASIFLIYDTLNDCFSLSSMYVDPMHRSKTISFINKVFLKLKDVSILDFTATEKAKKLFSHFSLREAHNSLYIKIPTRPPKYKFHEVTKNDSLKICDDKKIFYSPNMRVIALDYLDQLQYFIYKDISITKNNYFRCLSFLIYADNYDKNTINDLSMYCIGIGKIHIDFIDDENLKIKLKRFSVLTNKSSPIFHGNCELSIFDF